MNAVKNDTKAAVQKDAKEKTQRTGPNPTSWVGRTYLALLNAKKAMTKEDLVKAIHGDDKNMPKRKSLLMWKLKAVADAGKKNGLWTLKTDKGAYSLELKNPRDRRKLIEEATQK